MKDDKKENVDGNENENENTPETAEEEKPAKCARLDETEEEVKLVAEQNGTEEPEITNAEDNGVQEIKIDVPVIEIVDEEFKVETVNEELKVKTEDEEPKVDSVETDNAEIEPIKESPPAAKTTSTRRGGRGRGATARRGRSSR